jgi:hypothetical protein
MKVFIGMHLSLRRPSSIGDLAIVCAIKLQAGSAQRSCEAQALYFDAFSSSEPVPTSLENAMGAT